MCGIAKYRVAAENLVAAVAGEQQGQATLAGDARAVIGGGGRGIAEGLREGRGDRRERVQDVVGRHVVLERRGPEAPRGDPREFHLVVALGIETHADGGNPGPLRGGDAGDRRTVEATTEERPGLRRAIESTGNGGAKQLVQPVPGLRLADRGDVVERGPPIARHTGLAAVPVEAVAAFELGDAREDALRARQGVEVEVLEQCGRPDARRASREAPELPRMGAHAQDAPVHGPEHLAQADGGRHDGHPAGRAVDHDARHVVRPALERVALPGREGLGETRGQFGMVVGSEDRHRGRAVRRRSNARAADVGGLGSGGRTRVAQAHGQVEIVGQDRGFRPKKSFKSRSLAAPPHVNFELPREFAGAVRYPLAPWTP